MAGLDVLDIGNERAAKCFATQERGDDPIADERMGDGAKPRTKCGGDLINRPEEDDVMRKPDSPRPPRKPRSVPVFDDDFDILHVPPLPFPINPGGTK